MKGFLKGVGLLGLMLVCCAFLLAGCGEEKADTIKIGFNLPLTGDIPEVGEGSKNAAEMYLKDINEAGGLEVGGKKYPLEFVYMDNESKAESATNVALKLIDQENVVAIIGPTPPSRLCPQAVPATITVFP